MNGFSGDACNHWDLKQFKHDVDLAKQIGMTSYRMSIEWSRIELFPGKYDKRAINQYIEMLKYLKQLDFTTIVTLFHYSLPMWFYDIDHFVRKSNIKYFSSFCKKSAEIFDDYIDYYNTINEPNSRELFYLTYSDRKWKFNINTQNAHVACYNKIKKVNPKSLIGITLVLHQSEPKQPFTSHTERLFREDNERYIGIWLDFFLKGEWELLGHRNSNPHATRSLDYIGLNYYTHFVIDGDLLKDITEIDHSFLRANRELIGELRTDFGNGVYAEGLYRALNLLKVLKMPIMITENGAAENKIIGDIIRQTWIKRYLYAVKKFMSEDPDNLLIGYNYYTLIDSWEWDKGYMPKFGLYHVDHSNQTRTLRDGAKILIEQIKYSSSNLYIHDDNISKNNKNQLKKK